MLESVSLGARVRACVRVRSWARVDRLMCPLVNKQGGEHEDSGMDFGSPVRAAPWPGRPPRSPMHGPATAASTTAAGLAGAVAIPVLVPAPAPAAPAQGGSPSRSLIPHAAGVAQLERQAGGVVRRGGHVASQQHERRGQPADAGGANMKRRPVHNKPCAADSRLHAVWFWHAPHMQLDRDGAIGGRIKGPIREEATSSPLARSLLAARSAYPGSSLSTMSLMHVKPTGTGIIIKQVSYSRLSRFCLRASKCFSGSQREAHTRAEACSFLLAL